MRWKKPFSNRQGFRKSSALSTQSATIIFVVLISVPGSNHRTRGQWRHQKYCELRGKESWDPLQQIGGAKLSVFLISASWKYWLATIKPDYHNVFHRYFQAYLTDEIFKVPVYVVLDSDKIQLDPIADMSRCEEVQLEQEIQEKEERIAAVSHFALLCWSLFSIIFFASCYHSMKS